MKRILFFMTLFCVSMTAFTQNEFTGEGDGFSWDDPFNWTSGDVPFNGDDVSIDGFAVEFLGSPFTYGSLSLTGGANLLMIGSMNLSGNLNVDSSSVISPVVRDLNDYATVFLGGNYFFFGETDISFSAYVPQIGNSYQIIQGNSGFCDIGTTDIVPENQSGGGYETLLGIQCQADGILFVVLDINYTTAKSWDGEAGNGLWNTAANWDPNGVPLATDIVIINSPTGATVATDGAGTTTADRIIIGDNNNLIVNGNMEMFSFVGVNATGTLNWKGGAISRTDTNVQSFILNRGSILVDGGSNKSLENGFGITSQGSDASFIITEKGFDINDGEVSIFRGDLVIDGDNITIGYTSGSQHFLKIWNAESIIKSSGNGTSSINLTDVQIGNFASVISEQGTLAFGENLTNNGTLSGSGSLQLPSSYIEVGKIAPGSSPGILTVIGDLTTAPEAEFEIEIEGPTVGADYDQIVITDDAKLEGTISVRLGYLPPNDASFEMLTAASISTCNLPAQVTTDFNGTSYTFDVVCHNNKVYLNGPGAILSSTNFEADEIGVYPNPIQNELNIKLQTPSEGSWLLFNELGQKVMEGELGGIETRISTTNLVSGFYALQIKDINKATVTVKKIIKN